MIEEIQDGKVFLNHGPIQMVIEVFVGRDKNPELGFVIAKYVMSQFNQLEKYLDVLKRKSSFTYLDNTGLSVLDKMVFAVKQIPDRSINTLGAVAGSFSEIAVDKAIELGATRVMVNNGGDIAFKDIDGESITVGIPIALGINKTMFSVTISQDQEIGGICTSGLGGRSFTKGIATAAVVMANSASIADACATYIGNKTIVEDNNIISCYAEEIDSETDIYGEIVTLKAGNVSEFNKKIALENGAKATYKLLEDSIIKAGLISVDDYIITIPKGLEYKRM